MTKTPPFVSESSSKNLGLSNITWTRHWRPAIPLSLHMPSAPLPEQKA